MSDPDVNGYAADPTEVAGLLAAIVEGLPDDDLIVYHALTKEQATAAALVEALARARGERIARLKRDRTWHEVGALVGMKYQNAQRLSENAKQA